QHVGTWRGWDYSTKLQLERFLKGHSEVITGFARTGANRAAELAQGFIWVLLIPILAIFLLKDRSHFAGSLLGLIENTPQRDRLKSLMADLDAMLATFIRAQLSFSALGLVAYTSFLLLAQFPYAFALGAIGGLLEFIPFVGPVATALLIFGMAFLTGYPHWIVVLIFLLVWRGVQDYLVAPYLIGRGLKLHPLAVIFGVLV